VDLVLFSDLSVRQRACQHGIDPDALERVLHLEDLSEDLWVVASPGTKPAVVEALRDSLGRVKASGEHGRLVARFTEEWAARPCGAE
jgi:hypothetical protein